MNTHRGHRTLAAAARRAGRASPTAHLWLLAGACTASGLAAWLALDRTPRFLLFVATGLLVAGFAATLSAGAGPEHPA